MPCNTNLHFWNRALCHRMQEEALRLKAQGQYSAALVMNGGAAKLAEEFDIVIESAENAAMIDGPAAAVAPPGYAGPNHRPGQA